MLDHLDELVVRRVRSSRNLFPRGQEGLFSARDAGRGPRALDSRDRAQRPRVRRPAADVVVAGADLVRRRIRCGPRRYCCASTSPRRTRVTKSCRAALTRVADGTDPRAPWLEIGDVSKDTWMLSDQPVEQFSLLAQRQANQRLHRGGRDLPSRTADNLFWLGRYTERAEGAVRLLRSLVIRLGGEMGSTRDAGIAGARRRDADRAETLCRRAAAGTSMQEGREAVRARALDDPVRCRVQGRARDRARQRAAQRRGRPRAAVVRHLPDLARPHRGQLNRRSFRRATRPTMRCAS